MNPKNSLRHRMRMLMLLAVIATLVTTALLMAGEMWRITERVSQEYARLYTQEFVSDFQAILSKEIGLSQKAANSKALKDWMADESNLALKALAIEEIEEVNRLLADGNFFVAIGTSKHFYTMDSPSLPLDIAPIGVLSETDLRDVWFFKTQASDDAYLLNIDIDRFLKSMRVWVNVNVLDTATNRPLGIAGTGLYLNPLIQRIFEKHQKFGAKTVVVNEFGAIQLDSDVTNIRENSFNLAVDSQKTIFQYTRDDRFREDLMKYYQSPEKPTVFKLQDGNFQYAAIAPIKHTNWHVITFFSISALFNLTNFIPLILIAIGTIILMAIILNLVVTREFVRPFERMKESIQLKDLFQEEALFGIDRQDEFGVLALSIQQMTERLMHSVSVGMFLLAQDGNLVYANPYFLDQFKCSSKKELLEFLESRKNNVFKRPEDFRCLQQVFEDAKAQYAFELELINATDEHFWADIRLTKIEAGTGSWHYEGILINIQNIKENELTLTRRAEEDPLTGLYNRYYLEGLMLEDTSNPDANKDHSLILFDLDNFKYINDTWGHDVGDEVLIETARIAKSCLRQSDALIRWGGEEFAVLIRDTDLAGAHIAAEKIRLKLSNHRHKLAGTTTASFGVAQRFPHEPFIEWFKRADLALYRAKQAGRNQVHVSEELLGLRLLKLQWDTALETGFSQQDNQHRKLFELSEQLMLLASHHKTNEALLPIFDELITHTLTHFQDEIELLRATGYPEEAILLHESIHQGLQIQIRSWRDQLLQDHVRSTDIITIFIQDFIVGHLLKEDMYFYAHLKEHVPL